MADTRPTAVINRLIDDEYLHEQLTAGAARLRDAYRRGVLGRPEPAPPKHRGRRLAIVAVGAGVLVLVRAMHSRQRAKASPSAPA